ncbi:uncharacterized protein [Diadema antillarum]|uniref:uncharacterized protein n=1 Tax=Diadema antillarum TaxID=105358 RepID=UPI003A835FB1
MPKLYDCPTVDLTLVPDPDGCHLLKRELSTREFSNITCGNDTSLSNGVTFEDAGSSLVFTNVDCMTDFYFVVFLDGGQLVKTLTLEAGTNTDSTGVNFEVAYGYTVPCNDQPTVNTLLWQYITPGYYAPNADIALVWNELNFTDGTFRHVEETYFKASYLFVHFGNVSTGSSFKLQITGCNEIAKDIDPALSYLNNLLSATNNTLNIAEGIALSIDALDDTHELTQDETVLFLDALTIVGNGTLDLSDQPELAQNLTEALAEVATKVWETVTTRLLTVTATVAPGLTTPANRYASTEQENKRLANQQASAILIIESAIGTVTAEAGDKTIVATTPSIVIVSSPVEINENDGILDINLETLVPDGDEEVSEEQLVSVHAEMNLRDLLGKNINSSEVRFTAIQIKADDTIETPQNTEYNTSGSITGTNERVLKQESFINTDVMSLTLYLRGNVRIVPVDLSFVNIKQVKPYSNATLRSEMNSTCSWLTDNRKWSNRGCVTDYSQSNENKTTCECGHTTSFAVLMQVVEFEISKSNKIALGLFSYLGIGLSIMCLVIALFIFFTVGALRASERNMIHRNLMIALLLAYITFLAGINHATDIPILCTAVAALMHYLYTAVFCWMLIEGIHLYLMLVKVFGSEGSKRAYYLAVGWGAPIIIVAISVGIMYDDYGTEEKCWMRTGSPVIWAFVGPVIAVILFNMFVLVMVMRIIYRSSAINVDCPVDQVKAAAKGSLALLPILGVTWCLGIFAVGSTTIVFQYLFVICNSTQGILLFIFHCLLNSEVRNALKREKEKMGWSTAGPGISTTRKIKVHPSSDDPSSGKNDMKDGKSAIDTEEKSVAVLRPGKGSGKADSEGNKKRDDEIPLPGQIGEEAMEDTPPRTIRQEVTTERELKKDGWKINEQRKVTRTFVRVEAAE